VRVGERLSLNLGSIDGRPGERRLKVVGKGCKERFVPIEAPSNRYWPATWDPAGSGSRPRG